MKTTKNKAITPALQARLDATPPLARSHASCKRRQLGALLGPETHGGCLPCARKKLDVMLQIGGMSRVHALRLITAHPVLKDEYADWRANYHEPTPPPTPLGPCEVCGTPTIKRLSWVKGRVFEESPLLYLCDTHVSSTTTTANRTRKG